MAKSPAQILATADDVYYTINTPIEDMKLEIRASQRGPVLKTERFDNGPLVIATGIVSDPPRSWQEGQQPSLQLSDEQLCDWADKLVEGMADITKTWKETLNMPTKTNLWQERSIKVRLNPYTRYYDKNDKVIDSLQLVQGAKVHVVLLGSLYSVNSTWGVSFKAVSIQEADTEPPSKKRR